MRTTPGNRKPGEINLKEAKDVSMLLMKTWRGPNWDESGKMSEEKSRTGNQEIQSRRKNKSSKRYQTIQLWIYKRAAYF